MATTDSFLTDSTTSNHRFFENYQKKEIPSLYGLRGVAALVVVLHHYSYGTPMMQRFPGAYAVDLFFILSGLLITGLLLREHDATGTVSFKQFYARRALRLFPAFYTVWLFCDIFVKKFPEKWATFFYLGDYYVALTGVYNVLTIAWSLGVEEKFYLLWPALCRGVERSYLIWTVALMVVADQLYRVLLESKGYGIYAAFSFDTNLDCLLLGCLIALLAHRGIGPPRWMGSIFIPIFGIVTIYTCNEIVVHYALALILIWSILRAPWILNNRPIRYLGQISYSLYLCHIFVEWMIWTPILGHIAFPRWSLQLLSKVAVALVCASLLHFGIERPFLKIKNKLHRT